MQYITNEDWNEYYEEIDPAKRKEIYDRVVSECDDDGANELRGRLFEIRHKPPKNAIKDVDNGIWHMIMMPANNKIQYKIAPWTKSDIQKALTELGVADIDKSDEVSVSAVYWEIRNIARRYYSTCGGPKYARKLFGIMSSNDEEKLNKTAGDVWAMTVGVPRHYKLEDEMEIFCDAVKDEFFNYYENGRAAFETVRVEKETGKKVSQHS